MGNADIRLGDDQVFYVSAKPPKQLEREALDRV